MDALLIIDMQEGLRKGSPKHELPAVIDRINRLAARVRQRGRVIFIQHCGPVGDDFEPFTPGWAILDGLKREASDRTIRKTLNDAFFDTGLKETLAEVGADRVLVAGWATDLCVDSTIRTAAALGFRVVVVADCHTVSDRPHIDARGVIQHHHWIWTNLIARHPVTLAREAEL